MKDRSFIDSITSGKFQNQIAAGVETALTCMMGRKSAELGPRRDLGRHGKKTRKIRPRFNVKQFCYNTAKPHVSRARSMRAQGLWPLCVYAQAPTSSRR
jgi:hypothetical protein